MKNKTIQNTIIKTYRRELWSKFYKAVCTYKLVENGDHIMVCVSGGKDSFLLAACMKQLHEHSEFTFDVSYVVMNPGYDLEVIEKIKENGRKFGLDLIIYDTDIFDASMKSSVNPCYACSRFRRGSLYKKANELGCNKIALGHHFNDIIETTLLSIIYGGQTKTMLPKLHSKDNKDISLIRPLCLIKEKDIIRFVNHNELSFINCSCPLVKQRKDEDESKRLKIKKLIKDLNDDNPYVEESIFMAMHNVKLNNVFGFELDEKQTDFIDLYEREQEY